MEIDNPKTSVAAAQVFESDNTAISAVAGIYRSLVFESGFAQGEINSVTFLSSLSADLYQADPAYSTDLLSQQFSGNNISPDNTYIQNLWTSIYKTIYKCNTIFNGLNKSVSVSADVKMQLMGEILFIRAVCHFYAVNLFGDAPLILTDDYKSNAIAARTPRDMVYQQIVTDLTEAKALLTDKYVDGANAPTTDRVRVNRSAVTAMLARVYLYLKNWSNAEASASEVIDNSALYGLNSDLNKAFLASTSSFTNKEAIWQLMPVIPNDNTFEARVFILLRLSSYKGSLTNQFLQSFEPGDKRRISWVKDTTYGTTTLSYPFKYKVRGSSSPVAEYSMVLRVAEQYLIRAEARAQQDKLTGANSAASDIDIIRQRAGLGLTTATTKDQILADIEQERKVELFCEWGHRWLDLKRWDKADMVLSSLKPNWNDGDNLYPLPQQEMDRNPYLRPQNLGY